MCAALHNPSLAAKIEQALSVAEMRKETGVSNRETEQATSGFMIDP